MSLITPDITRNSVLPLSPNLGLTQREAEARLRQVGPNDPSPRQRGALLTELLVLFLNPLVIILLVAVVISIVVGQVTDAAIIFVIAMLSVVINFIQTYRSERSVRRLREHVSLTASVLRDGNWQELRRETVVPGDLVRLSAGDLVPADGFLLESRDLYVQQAALTGESMPAEKHVSSTTGEPSPEAQTGYSWELPWSVERQLFASRRPALGLRSDLSVRNCGNGREIQNLNVD
jgi:Mg2+-importing ATPase